MIFVYSLHFTQNARARQHGRRTQGTECVCCQLRKHQNAPLTRAELATLNVSHRVQSNACCQMECIPKNSAWYLKGSDRQKQIAEVDESREKKTPPKMLSSRMWCQIVRLVLILFVWIVNCIVAAFNFRVRWKYIRFTATVPITLCGRKVFLFSHFVCLSIAQWLSKFLMCVIVYTNGHWCCVNFRHKISFG